MRDVYVDLAGNIVKRPVLDQYADTGQSASVSGIYDWGQKSNGTLVTVANGYVFTATGYGTTQTQTTGSERLETSNYAKVSFVEHGSDLYLANGGHIFRVTLSGTFNISDVYDGDEDSPATVSSLTALDRYLIAVDDNSTGNFYWSDVNAPTSWGGYYAEAESKPDHLYHAQEVEGLLYLIGRRSTEVFYNDGVTPFTRLSQGIISDGTIAKRSPCYCNAIGTFAFLTPENRLVKIEGKKAISFSPSLDQFLGLNYSPTTVVNCVGNYFIWDGIPFYLLSSLGAGYSYTATGTGTSSTPQSGWSVAVNLLTNDWYEWGATHTDSRRLAFQGCAITNTPIGVLCGDANDGLIHRLTRGGVDDSTYGDIDPMIRSSSVDRGAPGVEKECRSLSFTFYAPQTHTGTSFSVDVKYSDDGGSTWSDERTISPTIYSGQKVYKAKSYNWGRYYNRQWQIDFSATSDIALGPVIEEFEYI
jgi:hypothetical protein